MSFREYEADARYCEEMDEQHRIDVDELPDKTMTELLTMLKNEVDIIKGLKGELKQFYEDVELAKYEGATDREIWGDGNTVPYPATVHSRIGIHKDNCKAIKKELFRRVR